MLKQEKSVASYFNCDVTTLNRVGSLGTKLLPGKGSSRGESRTELDQSTRSSEFLKLMMNNERVESIIAVQEERARIGGVEVSKKTLVAATDEG